MQRTEGWPDAVSLDPDERASPAIDELLRSLSSTPVLLLAVGAVAQRGGWAANATLALADSLAASGERVVVADLSLDRPELHERLGVDNTEGLTDVFLFGAAVRAVVEGHQDPDHPSALLHQARGGAGCRLLACSASLVAEKVDPSMAEGAVDAVVGWPTVLEWSRGVVDRFTF